MKSFLRFLWSSFYKTITFRSRKLNALHPMEHKNLHSVLFHPPIHPNLKSNVKIHKRKRVKGKTLQKFPLFTYIDLFLFLKTIFFLQKHFQQTSLFTSSSSFDSDVSIHLGFFQFSSPNRPKIKASDSILKISGSLQCSL